MISSAITGVRVFLSPSDTDFGSIKVCDGREEGKIIAECSGEGTRIITHDIVLAGMDGTVGCVVKVLFATRVLLG